MHRVAPIVATLTLCAAAAPSLAQDPAPRPAEEIVREFHRVQTPSRSTGTGPEAAAEFKAAIAKAAHRKSALALELYAAYPEHAEVPGMLWVHWCTLTFVDERPTAAIQDACALLEREQRGAIRVEAVFAVALAVMEVDELDRAVKVEWIDRAAALRPTDERASGLLLELAAQHTADPAEIRALAERVLATCDGERKAVAAARSLLKRLERVGQELALAGEVVGRDERIDLASKRGGPVVVTLWAGFGGELSRELSAVSRHHATRPDVPVIGVYVWKHEGGREALAAALREHGVAWPNLYPEETFATPWDGPWATSRTPLHLLLDGEGVVVALSHRFATLASLLPDPPASGAREGR